MRQNNRMLEAQSGEAQDRLEQSERAREALQKVNLEIMKTLQLEQSAWQGLRERIPGLLNAPQSHSASSSLALL